MVHTELPDWPCPDCGKKFKRKFDLNRHRVTVHLGVRNFPCDLCGKRFADLKVNGHFILANGFRQYNITAIIWHFYNLNLPKMYFNTGERSKFIIMQKIENLKRRKNDEKCRKKNLKLKWKKNYGGRKVSGGNEYHYGVQTSRKQKLMRKSCDVKGPRGSR